MARVKPDYTIPVIKSLEEADSVLAQLTGMRRYVGLIEAEMNDAIDAVKLKAAKEAESPKLAIARMEQGLARFATENKEELFAKKKSCELSFGTIGFRASSKIRLLSKMTWERVLQTLRDTGMTACIRVKQEPDKEALKALSPEHLRELGCKVVQEDVFFYETADQELKPDAGEAA